MRIGDGLRLDLTAYVAPARLAVAVTGQIRIGTDGASSVNSSRAADSARPPRWDR
jgi:hypothetical protein